MWANDVVQLGWHVLCVAAELPHAMAIEVCGALFDANAKMFQRCHCVC